MTGITKRYNIKPIFGLVSATMVIMFCLLATRTSQRLNIGQSAISNNILYYPVGFVMFGIIYAPLFFAFGCIIYTFLSLSKSFSYNFISPFLLVAFLSSLPFFALMIYFVAYQYTGLALGMVPIFLASVFIKLGKWLGLLAFVTVLCYDCFRHNQFLSNWLCLEPLVAQTTGGSFYYIARKKNIK